MKEKAEGETQSGHTERTREAKDDHENTQAPKHPNGQCKGVGQYPSPNVKTIHLLLSPTVRNALGTYSATNREKNEHNVRYQYAYVQKSG